jgi:hypothetical protein
MPVQPSRNHFHTMKINRAIGLGIGILVLQILMSEVFNGFEETLLATFDTTQTALGAVGQGISTTSRPTLQNFVPRVR